jgi:hypothetical protein
MALEFDEKGKFYTDVITKEEVLTQIQTLTHCIRGFVHVRKGERLSDEINNASLFLALTNVEIYSLEGEIIFTSDFLAINREHIVWLMPIEENKTDLSKPENTTDGDIHGAK